MKKTLLLLSLLGSFFAANAQFTSPNLGMHFVPSDLVTAGAATYTNGEYTVTQALILEATDTLSINTNETIKFGPGVLVTIKGTLLINPPDSVKLTNIAGSGNFNALRFESLSRVSYIRKTIVERSSGIRVLNAAVEIDSCIVRNNDKVNQSGAINISGASPVIITNCKIYRNSRAGVSSPTNGANVSIRNCWFFENGVEPGLYPAINLGPATAGGKIEVIGNTIIGINAATNKSGGIAVANLLSAPTVTNILIEGNTVKLNSYGITITGSNIHGYIKRNILQNNNVNPAVLTTGSGINFNTTGTNQEIVTARNLITGNHWGITIQAGTAVASGPHPMLGRIGSADTANVGMNQIYNNVQGTGASAVTWDLYNNTADSIYAENNMWGTTNLTDIETHIFHKTDDATHGVVKFNPIFGAVSGIKPFAANTFSVSPNPATDVVNIRLAGKQSANTTVRFYNALGQQVKTIKSSHTEIQVNTRNFAKGLYTYRIENANAVQTGKLVLVK